MWSITNVLGSSGCCNEVPSMGVAWITDHSGDDTQIVSQDLPGCLCLSNWLQPLAIHLGTAGCPATTDSSLGYRCPAITDPSLGSGGCLETTDSSLGYGWMSRGWLLMQEASLLDLQCLHFLKMLPVKSHTVWLYTFDYKTIDSLFFRLSSFFISEITLLTVLRAEPRSLYIAGTHYTNKLQP